MSGSIKEIAESSQHEDATPSSPKGWVESISYGPGGMHGIISNTYVFGAAFLASLGDFSFGYDQGVKSITNVMSTFHQAFPQATTAFGTSFMTSILLLGAFIGCLLCPVFTAAQTYGALVAGRAIGEIGVGTLAMTAPLYISEISPPELRGAFLVLESVSTVAGVVIAFWITYGTQYITNEASFRLPFALQMVSSTLLGIGIHFFPSSPRWLALVNRCDECLASLGKLRKLPSADERVQAEYKGIITEVEFQRLIREKTHSGVTGIQLEIHSWLDRFRRRNWHRTAVGCGVLFFQQFSGINAFIYYAPTLFESLGQSGHMALIMSGIFNVLQLVAVLVCFVIIDRVGRRRLAIFGAVGNTVRYIVITVLAGLFSTDWHAHQGPGWATVAMAFCFILVYGVSRVALSVCVNWLSKFIVAIAIPPMMASRGYQTYIFFTLVCFLAVIWAMLLVPETKGKTLEKIDVVFGDVQGQKERAIMREAMVAVGQETV
ncbi:hypothetical protein N7539_008404 [Penicillium diatomitis]|uniref:Major facilitator superfamily (MFS) profile domain-containing protein n=1 Tax=Penicillium diatomitis TaxID=2819901 RepID=A0A9W9WTT1_9EURO|nr:uncharacterized protein N7539_008404 [Penicillium diatomitis]KAJ5475338.1 hypothetical protein N7539_008404 [Penicillium diatomitis]